MGIVSFSLFVQWFIEMIAHYSSAFGGMIAFCIIVGDTIPHVFSALMPHLTNTLPLSLLANRQVVIILLILGVSFPLSLFRDIAKVRFYLVL